MHSYSCDLRHSCHAQKTNPRRRTSQSVNNLESSTGRGASLDTSDLERRKEELPRSPLVVSKARRPRQDRGREDATEEKAKSPFLRASGMEESIGPLRRAGPGEE